MPMRVLLDTNIIIHRENKIISNYSIGHLYKWLDRLKCTKLVHPFTVDEIKKYNDENTRNTFQVKLESYEIIKTVKEPDSEFINLIKSLGTSDNDYIDNTLLYEVFSNRVDILITKDKKMHRKAEILGIGGRVYTINQFISVSTSKFPTLVEYKMLAVKQEYFGNVDLNTPFFDSFKRDYVGFESWFNKKCDEIAYVCADARTMLGFLYLKVEDETEDYSSISPIFKPKRRLKIGTLKVEATGFRLGERFLKIIFDNALKGNVDEIYTTMFDERDELNALADLLIRWGFERYGQKITESGKEDVFVKGMNKYCEDLSVKQNFPNILYQRQKFILPIFDKYHTSLLPDSKLSNEREEDFLNKDPHKYALQKVYISWAPERNINPGDFLLFYRPGADGSNKKYTSVVTTLGIVDEIISGFDNKEQYMKHCQNRSVFTDEELEGFWVKHRYNLMIIKFIYVESLGKKLTLDYLWNKGIVSVPNGPRPFFRLTDAQFNNILKDSQTIISFK